MALPAKKYYKGAPANALLTSSPSSADTTMTVDTITGWPTSFPFYCVVDPGTSKEEKVRVTAISTLTLTVVRAQDNTTAVSHAQGAAIYPVFTAIEASEANEIASIMTTKGDIITNDGSNISRLAVGATNTYVLQVDSTATNGIKWGQVATAGIADGAITSAKILDGTIVNADIDASAAIALSKLASGALPTSITIASANIVDSTIATGDIADAAVTAAKLSSNIPRGLVGTITSTSTQTVGGGSDADISGLTLTKTLTSGRSYLATVTITCGWPAAGTGVLNFRINYGGTNTAYQSIAIPSTTTGDVTFVGQFYFVASSTASTTVKVTGNATSQAIDLVGGTNNHRLTVADIGVE